MRYLNRLAVNLNRSPHLMASLCLWAVTSCILLGTLPLLPIDETRYLTVAWEMSQSSNWLLPTLNGSPYSHKPPLLFWSINLMWLVFGPEIWAARLVPIFVTTAVILAVYAFARTLFPNERRIAALASSLILLPPFLIYGSLIMFDQMLTLWVILGMLAIWKAEADPRLRHFAMIGLWLGLALLTKGPVALVHFVPPLLLIRFWSTAPADQLSAKKWSRGSALAIILGAAMILAWAIPAALIGGPEFSRMIFWEQSAGRMIKAFDHQAPAWFYIPVLLVSLAPFLFWPALWRGVRRIEPGGLPKQVRFLLCWIIPTLFFFSAISGKQPHYLLPHLPAYAILAAWLANRHLDSTTKNIRPLVGLFSMLFVILASGPLAARMIDHDTHHEWLDRTIGQTSFILPAFAGVMAVWALLRATTIDRQGMAIAFASSLLVIVIALQGHVSVFDHYDLEPFAQVLETFKGQPVTFLRSNGEGELGYLARLEPPVHLLETTEQAINWAEANPSGVIVFRHRGPACIEGLRPLYTRPFRRTESYSIMQKATSPVACP